MSEIVPPLESQTIVDDKNSANPPEVGGTGLEVIAKLSSQGVLDELIDVIPVAEDAPSEKLSDTSNPEKKAYKEWISGVAEESGAFVYGWIPGTEVDESKRQLLHGFQGMSSNPNMNFTEQTVAGRLNLPDAAKKHLQGQGVNEHVFIEPIKGTTADKFVPGTSRPNERSVAIRYEAFTSEGLLAVLVLPESVAEDVAEKALEDPSIYRDLVESSLCQNIGLNKSWDGEKAHEGEYIRSIKPPYGNWQRANDGVQKMAINNFLTKAPALIVEF